MNTLLENSVKNKNLLLSINERVEFELLKKILTNSDGNFQMLLIEVLWRLTMPQRRTDDERIAAASHIFKHIRHEHSKILLIQNFISISRADFYRTLRLFLNKLNENRQFISSSNRRIVHSFHSKKIVFTNLKKKKIEEHSKLSPKNLQQHPIENSHEKTDIPSIEFQSNKESGVWIDFGLNSISIRIPSKNQVFQDKKLQEDVDTSSNHHYTIFIPASSIKRPHNRTENNNSTKFTIFMLLEKNENQSFIHSSLIDRPFIPTEFIDLRASIISLSFEFHKKDAEQIQTILTSLLQSNTHQRTNLSTYSNVSRQSTSNLQCESNLKNDKAANLDSKQAKNAAINKVNFVPKSRIGPISSSESPQDVPKQGFDVSYDDGYIPDLNKNDFEFPRTRSGLEELQSPKRQGSPKDTSADQTKQIKQNKRQEKTPDNESKTKASNCQNTTSKQTNKATQTADLKNNKVSAPTRQKVSPPSKESPKESMKPKATRSVSPKPKTVKVSQSNSPDNIKADTPVKLPSEQKSDQKSSSSSVQSSIHASSSLLAKHSETHSIAKDSGTTSTSAAKKQDQMDVDVGNVLETTLTTNPKRILRPKSFQSPKNSPQSNEKKRKRNSISPLEITSVPRNPSKKSPNLQNATINNSKPNLEDDESNDNQRSAISPTHELVSEAKTVVINKNHKSSTIQDLEDPIESFPDDDSSILVNKRPFTKMHKGRETIQGTFDKFNLTAQESRPFNSKADEIAAAELNSINSRPVVEKSNLNNLNQRRQTPPHMELMSTATLVWTPPGAPHVTSIPKYLHSPTSPVQHCLDQLQQAGGEEEALPESLAKKLLFSPMQQKPSDTVPTKDIAHHPSKMNPSNNNMNEQNVQLKHRDQSKSDQSYQYQSKPLRQVSPPQQSSTSIRSKNSKILDQFDEFLKILDAENQNTLNEAEKRRQDFLLEWRNDLGKMECVAESVQSALEQIVKIAANRIEEASRMGSIPVSDYEDMCSNYRILLTKLIEVTASNLAKL